MMKRPKQFRSTVVEVSQKVSTDIVQKKSHTFSLFSILHVLKLSMFYLFDVIRFLTLLITYFVYISIHHFLRSKFFPHLLGLKLFPDILVLYMKVIRFLDPGREGTISRIDLIELSIRNMRFKKTRSMITIGGMAIGIGTIVFLVSLGYGLQELVISRIARLDEMKQTDILRQTGSLERISDRTIAAYKDIDEVSLVLPVISVVGKITYNNSISDVAVYGVTSDYLKQSAIKPVKGTIFDSNELTTPVEELRQKGDVRGESIAEIQAQKGESIQPVTFTISEGKWFPVRSKPSTSAPIIGYSRSTGSLQEGTEVWGDVYSSDDGRGNEGRDNQGNLLGRWMESHVLLWNQANCEQVSTEKGTIELVATVSGVLVPCVENFIPQMRSGTSPVQNQRTGYFEQYNMQIAHTVSTTQRVLGTSTRAGGVLAEADAVLEDMFVEIASESGTAEKESIHKVSLSASAKRQAIVNRALLKILGLSEESAIGKKFSTSFIVTGDLLNDKKEKIMSNNAEYTIVAVTPDDKTPVFYVPFIDIRSLGVVNYSQVRIVAKSQDTLAGVRSKIAAMGFVTYSVADTVAQVTALFATARIILALLGTVALAVAALGMFNTLTVSLLERTREVGLMKAMGMKSTEVKELFLTESMIMGFFGGILGILFGFFSGKLVSAILSAFSLIKGAGVIDISYIPLPFTVLIILLSLLIGILTGLYPSRRATKISALNALRYE